MLPTAFLARMEGLLGEAYPAFLAAYDAPPMRALHVGGKMTAEKLGELLGDRVRRAPFAADAFYRLDSDPVGGDPLHHAGAYYMQEPSAMLPVLCAELTVGERVLDLCAAPGGKSTQIANRIGDAGLLVSNEYVQGRCVTLAGNLERMGVRSAVVTRTDTATLAEVYPAYFDAVVIDAPCSGEGMFRRDAVAVSEWSLENISACAARQRRILADGAEMVRDGGRLIYSTCTFSTEENEENVLWFLRTHPDFVAEEVPSEVVERTASGVVVEDTPLGREVAQLARRAYPHRGDGEGQFMFRFRRVASAEAAIPAARASRKGDRREDVRALTREERQVWDTFLDGVGIKADALPTPLIFKGGVSLLDASVRTPCEITYARGVLAGQIEKGRFCPAHFFFSAYGGLFASRLALTAADPRLAAYIRGETVPCDLADGWAVVTVEGAPLGGIKVVAGVGKNHYPKGLRGKR